MVLVLNGVQKMQNQIIISGPSDAELEAMFAVECAEKAQVESDLGEYIENYQRDVRVLNARVQAYEESERIRLYNSYAKKWSMIKAYRSLREVA